MKTRTGKIAQLPKSIRDDLNHRLANGKQGPGLLEWLNALPETKELLAEKFDNQPITKSNLSDWRQGGFLEWQQDQAREARIQRISESGEFLHQAETGDLFENFARIAVAELMADLDGLQKLQGEKRTQYLHLLVRDLARLQNAYNRSRWSALAWTKYNDTLPPKPDLSAIASATAETLPELVTHNSQLETPTSVVPDRAQSQTVPPDDSEPKPDGNGMYVIHFTNCDCDEPCPKCHAPDSNYPSEEASRDRQYYRKHGRYPCDRHGKTRALINVACDCSCERCDINTTSVLRADAGKVALPRDPSLRHEPQANDDPQITTNPQPSINSATPNNPLPLNAQLPPLNTPLTPHADFLRKMSHLKNASY